MNAVKSFMLITAMTALLVFIGYTWLGELGVAMALGVGLLMNGFAYFFSDSLVLASYGARVLSDGEAPQLQAIVANLAQRAGLPMPRVAIIPEDTPNAFATGRNPEHAVVAVTEGLMDMLGRQELEGVIAHELGHVKHRDILIGSLTAVLAQAILFVSSMARFIAPRDEEGRSNPLAGLAIAIVGPIAALLLQMAISRSREYQADEYAVHITGRPDMLAGALAKLVAWNAQAPMRDAAPATAHMMIVNPLSSSGFSSLFSTHPRIEKRIARLNAMSIQMW